MITIYFTVPSRNEAVKIGKILLKENLVVCVNIFPISSIYWWENKICEDKEFAVIMKTNSKLFNKIVKKIKELHSYKLPVIEKFDVKTYPEVEKWVKNFTK